MNFMLHVISDFKSHTEKIAIQSKNFIAGSDCFEVNQLFGPASISSFQSHISLCMIGLVKIVGRLIFNRIFFLVINYLFYWYVALIFLCISYHCGCYVRHSSLLHQNQRNHSSLYKINMNKKRKNAMQRNRRNKK